MMPRRIYRLVEWQLHNAERTAERCREAVQDAVDAAAPNGGMGQKVQSEPGDRTAKAGLILLEKGQALDTAEKWLICIRDTRENFRGRLAAEIAAEYYGKNVTVLQVAEKLNYERQTINRYRDHFVSYLALLAASRGLIHMEGTLEQRAEAGWCEAQRKRRRRENAQGTR